MGGLAAAATLTRIGLDVRVYEQAPAFQRLGAGIQQGANAVKVLRRLGLEERLRDVSYQPSLTKYRNGETGELLWERQQGGAYEQKYGAPHLLLHRADLHDALASAVPPDLISLNKRVIDFADSEEGVQLRFADGATAHADLMIASDGVHSFVRDRLVGAEQPRFTGRVAYRTTFPASLLGGLEIDGSTKWMAANRHIVIYYINPREDEIYFVTSTPEPDFSVESWSSKGDMDELRAEYATFHPHVRAVLEACPQAHKWALVERDPLPKWSEGRVALLGDACHPMTPYMAQGAGTAIEDAAVLSRCLAGVGRSGITEALVRYEATRKPRTSWIQASSSTNDIERFRREQDAVYSYDAWTTELAGPSPMPLSA
ncbi:MAG: salicylate 1-monooxygenase [Alphaproteobacteria bacterium]|nr:MAG: salicylate 1-monooxygenase [Alphaproteobacteria bacterium]